MKAISVVSFSLLLKFIE